MNVFQVPREKSKSKKLSSEQAKGRAGWHFTVADLERHKFFQATAHFLSIKGLVEIKAFIYKKKGQGEVAICVKKLKGAITD